MTVVGVVASLREKQNKEKGTRFGFFTLEDLTGTIEVICWGSRPAQGTRPAQKGWADWEQLVKGDEPIVVHGEVRVNARDEENPRAEITATEIELLSAGAQPEDAPRWRSASTPSACSRRWRRS